MSKSPSLWLRGLFYMMGFGGTWFILIPCILLAIEGNRDLHFRSVLWFAVGVVLIAAGAALSGYAGYHLIQIGHGTPFPLDPTRRLVTSGPYRVVRNPQAIATLLIILGEIASVRSKAILLMMPLTIAYLEALAAPFEHRELTRRFGAAYLEYQQKVPKWLPARPSAKHLYKARAE